MEVELRIFVNGVEEIAAWRLWGSVLGTVGTGSQVEYPVGRGNSTG
jgi:hypothetical protein